MPTTLTPDEAAILAALRRMPPDLAAFAAALVLEMASAPQPEPQQAVILQFARR